MIFGNQLRSSKMTALFVGVVVFIAIFVGLVYNHSDAFQEVSPSVQHPPPSVDDSNTIASPPEKEPETQPPPPASEDEHDHEHEHEHEHEHSHDQAEDLEPEQHEPEPTTEAESAEPTEDSSAPPPNTNDPSNIPDLPLSETLQFYFNSLVKSHTKVDQRKYTAWGAINFEMPADVTIGWKKPQKEKICIIDLDNRPFNESGQVFGPDTMSWDDAGKVHGLSLGILNHWVYAKIHGYKYYYIDIDAYPDRRASWKKPPIMSEILKDHEACLYLDSDAIFYHLDLPFEWLMNYWSVHPSNNSLALAFDPAAPNNQDEFGEVYLNTGFIIAQNNKKTYEIMDAWKDCPEEGGKHPNCTIFRTNGPGRPTDQGGFGTYIRYDYPKDIKSLKCDEANGFPESHSGCDGKFIRHLWTGKNNWIKATVGQQMPGGYLKEIHERYLAEKPQYYLTEKQLMERPRRV